MKRLRATVVALLATLAAGASHAGEHTVVIHHMEIQAIDAEMRVGDVVTFDNQSDMAHNLYLTYPDGTVDNLDTQVPGTQKSLTLRQGGSAVIKCWIHPIINAQIEILPAADTPKN
jgi:plastocyanin